MKKVGFVDGFLVLAATEPGRFSFDA